MLVRLENMGKMMVSYKSCKIIFTDNLKEPIVMVESVVKTASDTGGRHLIDLKIHNVCLNPTHSTSPT